MAGETLEDVLSAMLRLFLSHTYTQTDTQKHTLRRTGSDKSS